jgi:DNA-binding transcriptional LysR family regulator
MSNAEILAPMLRCYGDRVRLNLRQIEAFRAAFQTGSMTAAGALLHISQPAVSRLIRDLEADSGLRLFDRKAGRMTATTDAVKLYREVERSFHGLDRMGRAIAEIKRHRGGDLKIAASLAPSFYCLPMVMSRLRTQWPKIGLSLGTCPSPDVLDIVARQQADIGVAVVPAEAPGVVIEPLKVHNALCVVPARHPYSRRRIIRPRDLEGQPLLVISDYSLFQKRIQNCLQASGVSPNVVFEASFSAPICAMVAAGFGLSILDPLTAIALQGEAMVALPFEPAMPYELKLIFPAGQPLSEHGEAFSALVRNEVERLGKAGSRKA